MSVTKILARNARLDQAIQYVLNGDKTDHQILSAHQNCDPGREFRQMMDTKRDVGKLDGRQCYHIIQSFKPGEITPELALKIAKEFAAEYLPDYEVVIGTHVDKDHIHSHLVFNSVNAQTGEKYHVSTQEYYRQIRAISDRLCQEHGLSVIMEGQPSQAVSYIEWLRQSKGQSTFRSMLEADLRSAIEDANDLGHFFMLVEHMGYEISHGNRLGFRLRGQERFMIPGRRNPLFTEEGIQAAIQGNLEAIESRDRPAVIYRTPYRSFEKHPKYTGFMALYVHYLYVLGKIEQRQYPPRMTPKLHKRTLEELAKLDRAGADLTPEETERLAAYKRRKAEAVKRCREKQKAAQPPKPQQRTLKELAKYAEAGLPLTPEEAERLEAHRNRKKAALQDLKARAETDPEAAAELAQQRAQQSEAVKKSRQKMYADAAAGDPEAQARYERQLAARRENYHRKKQAETEAAQAS